jgi:hypothetical protein
VEVKRRVAAPQQQIELSGQLHARLLYLGRNCPQYTLHRRMGGPQTPSGNLAEEKKTEIMQYV